MCSVIVYAQNPGGVSTNLTFWYKADAGTSTTTDGVVVTSWTDQSSSGLNATEVSPGPTYTQIGSSFNPALDFSNSSSGGLVPPDNAAINTSSYTAKSFSVAFRTGSDVTSRQMIYEQGGGTRGLSIYVESGSVTGNLWTASSTHYNVTLTIAANTSYVATFVWDGASTSLDLWLNGTQGTTVTTAPATLASHGGDPGLGLIDNNTRFPNGDNPGDGESFIGEIMEMAYYNNHAFTASERNQIESYLALKYGVGLSTDYTASNGSTTPWATSSNVGYTTGVTGIGRDDNSGLNQKQSQSSAATGLVAIGLGTVASDNASNSNTFTADLDFVMWGHNGGNVAFTSTGAPTGKMILERQWKVQETSTVGTVKIRVPDNSSSDATKLPSANSIKLLIDSDGDFSSGASTTSMILNGTYWEANINLNSGDYFTFSVDGASLSTTTNGDETGPVNIVFTVTLTATNSTGSPITFDIDDAGTGSATSGSDYTAIPAGAKISVDNGFQSGTYTVNVTDDALQEGTETLDVTISNPSDPTVTIGGSSATATIADDDASVPGNVGTNLIFWFKADNGTSTTVNGASVSTWTDQTFSGRDATTSGTSPNFTEVQANFNPALDFSNSTTGGLTMADDAQINTGSSTAKSYTIVITTGSDVTTRQMVYEEGGGGSGMNLSIASGQLTANLYTGNADNAASTSISANTTYVISFVYDGGNTRWDLYVNGTLATSETTSPGTLGSHSGDVGIGVIDNNTQYSPTTDVSSGESFLGHIQEMVYYNTEVYTASERNQLESYLAIKYGITKSNDYIAADGTTLWSQTTNSGYTNGIAGIGQNDISGLVQKQSKSETSDALLSIGLVAIESSNAQNTGSFSANKDFMIWGHDGDGLTFTTTGAPSGSFITERAWRIQENGTVGSVKIQAPASTSSESTKLPAASAINILQDADGDFTSGAVSTAMTLVSTNWEADIDFSNGQYFAFSTGGADLSVTTNGNEAGPVNIVFTVTLIDINTTGSAITFDIDDAGTGSAISGSDYTAIPGSAQISVANGSQTGTYTVVVTDDGVEESQETVDVIISNPSDPGTSIGTAEATATISDNDNSLPGGVSTNFVYWLRANSGTSTTTEGATVTSWTDQAFNGNDASDVSPGPTYSTSVTNFNPALNFTSIAGGMGIGDDNSINTSNFTGKSFSVAFRTGSDVSTRQVLYEQGGGTHGLNLYIESGSLTSNLWVSSADNAASTSISANTDYVYTFIYDGGSTRWDGYLNGSAAMNDASAPATLSSHTGDIGVGVINQDTQFDGGIDVSSGEGFLGHISEIVYYSDEVFTAAERNRVESYLMLKYGITSSENFTASTSTVVWNATTNATYHNDVAGISRDGTSGLSQGQSQSVNPDAIVTMGLGSIASDNASNTGIFNSDEEFLIWGNDNGTLSGAATNASLTAGEGLLDELQRVWRTEETGTMGSVQIAFPKATVDGYFSYISYGGLHLRVADNAALTSNVTDVALSVATVNSVESYVANFTFTGTQYFSLVQKGSIIWTGSEWRGGSSSTTDHAPSNNANDASKTLYILSGTASTSEGVSVANVEISSGATFTLNPQSCLVVSGSMINNGTLSLEATASGYAQYKGPATVASFQQHVPDEGWHNIASPFSDATWDDLSFSSSNGFINHPLGGASLDTCIYCTLWWYDASTDNGSDVGFGSSTAYGTWRSSVNGSETFDASKGWIMQFDENSGFSSAPWTINITATLNGGSVNQLANQNNGGWNLVANPYASVLDWDVVDNDLAAAGINTSYHVWDHSNTNYATYDAGVGTLTATQYIAPFQGFFIQTAVAGGQNSGDVFRSFSLESSDQPDGCQSGSGNFFKTTSDEVIRIKTTHTGSGKVDEAVLRFRGDADYNFDHTEDVNKLFTTYSDVAAVYSKFDQNFVSIASLPFPNGTDSVFLGVHSRNGSQLQIEVIETPPGLNILLEDRKTGIMRPADETYSFVHDKRWNERFLIYYSYNNIEAKTPSAVPFTAYISNENLLIDINNTVLEGTWYLTSLTGTIVRNGNVAQGVNRKYEVDVSDLRPGVYVFAFSTEEKLQTLKIPIIR